MSSVRIFVGDEISVFAKFIEVQITADKESYHQFKKQVFIIKRFTISTF